MTKKVDIIFGTRPEAIKMAMLCKKFKASPLFQTRIISTGQHREMLTPILEWFEITPDASLDLMTENQTLASLTSRCISKLQEFFDQNGLPDILLVQGDTTTAFICALVSFYNKIKIGHVEAGLRTNNKYSPWPEEMNRTLVTRLSDIHFTPTEKNSECLLKEGVSADRIFETGNTVIDSLIYSKTKIEHQNTFAPSLKEFYTGRLKSNKIVLITGHRRENFGQGFESICGAIKKLASEYPDVYFVYPVHLNPNVRGPVMNMLGNTPNICLIDPLGYADFISLMMRSYLILTDSGGVQEEGPSLGKPVLVMRENTERPEAIEHGTVKLVGTDAEKICKEVRILLTDQNAYKSMEKVVNPYGDGQSVQRIFDAIYEFKES